MFENSRNIRINGGNFATYVSTIQAEGQKGMEILQDNIAPGAFHNSDESCDPPKCHPRTRQAILAKIMAWIQTPDVERLTFFMWLHGPAGSGKSAIAHTIAEMCYVAGLLAASFFFSRNATGRNDKTRFVATLAYQLALSIPEMRKAVFTALETDPMLVTRSLEAQLLALIVQPFKTVVDNSRIAPSHSPLLIIVDGLDECQDPRSQTNILTALSTLLQRHSLPFYFLIASRPEYHIRRAFDGVNFSSSTAHIVLDNNYRPDEDIKLFFEEKLTELKREHPAGSHLPVYWPYGQDGRDVVQLVQRSSGQFIYASTVIKYVCSHRHWPPERLEIVFGVPHGEDDSSPFSDLDAFYHHILTAAFITENKKIWDIIILLVLRPLGRQKQTKRLIELFWGYRPGEVDMLLSDLHSVIDVPPRDDDQGEPRISHASLSDFLLNRERSGKFYIDKRDAYTKLALRSVHHLRSAQSLQSLGEELLMSVFYESCLRAKETPELLEQLYLVDPSPIFNDYRAPELVCWLAKHHHPSYKTDLMQHHKTPFHESLRRRLLDLPEVSTMRSLLAAMSLPQFLPPILDILLILEDGLPGPQGNDPDEFFGRLHHIRTYVREFTDSSLSDHPEYCILYSQFLRDSAVAEHFFVNKADYSSLAQSVWEFIRRRHYLKHDSADSWTSSNSCIPSRNWVYRSHLSNSHPLPGDYYRFGKVALDLLPILLANSLRASDAHELVSCLKDTPPQPWGSETDPLCTEKFKAGEAISNYLEAVGSL